MILEIWYNQCQSDEERQRVEQDFALAYNAFERLTDILRRKTKTDTSFSDYEVANWAYLQADKNGYNRALKEILNLINQKEE